MFERRVDELMNLKGRVALITGATGYLGSAMARGLAEIGATVVVSSRNLETAEEAVDELQYYSSRTHFAVAMDHLSEDSVKDGFEQAVIRAGQVDVVVANGYEATHADWSNTTAEEFNRQLANLTGYFLIARELRNHVVGREADASVILVSSMYGVVGSYPQVYEGIQSASPVAYHAWKGGVIQLARHLAVYWVKDRVRVNTLSPGAFPAKDSVSPKLIHRIQQHIPLGRIGEPSDLKAAIAFLASDASSFMTGQNLLIDGGWTAW